jgi:hypothetical protein
LALPVVIVVACYCVLAMLAYWPVSPLDSSHLFGGTTGDPVLTTWFLAWTPFAITHGHNLLFSNYLDYPSGVNLATNTLTSVLGLIGSPITLTLGPVATANFLMRLALASSATSMCLVLRSWTRWWPAAFFGGLLYGFGAYMSYQGTAHLDLTFVAIPPLLLWCLSELLVVQRRSAVRVGLLLGLLCAAQLLINAEVLADCVVVGVVGVLMLAIWHRSDVVSRARTAAPGIVIAAASFAVVSGYPLWFLLAGPGHVTGPVVPVWLFSQEHADLLGLIQKNFVVHLTLANGAPYLSLGTVMTFIDNQDYLGLPLTAVTLVFVAIWRRVGIVRLAGVLALTAFVLSLGPHLNVGGAVTGIPLPGILLTHVPLLDNTIWDRYALLLIFAVSIVFAVGLDRLVNYLQTLPLVNYLLTLQHERVEGQQRAFDPEPGQRQPSPTSLPSAVSWIWPPALIMRSWRIASSKRGAQVVCSKCEEVNTQDREFCRECGSPIAHVCAACGSAIAAAVTSCERCDRSLGASGKVTLTKPLQGSPTYGTAATTSATERGVSASTRPARTARLFDTGRAARSLVPSVLCVGVAVVSFCPLASPYPITSKPIGWPTQLVSSLRQSVPTGGVVLAFPYVVSSTDAPMAWQAIDQMQFRLVGGYAIVPDPTGGGAFHVNPSPALSTVDLTIAKAGTGALASTLPRAIATAESTCTALTGVLTEYSVDAVVVWPTGSDPSLVERLLEPTLGMPSRTFSQALVWYHVPQDLTRQPGCSATEVSKFIGPDDLAAPGFSLSAWTVPAGDRTAMTTTAAPNGGMAPVFTAGTGRSFFTFAKLSYPKPQDWSSRSSISLTYKGTRSGKVFQVVFTFGSGLHSATYTIVDDSTQWKTAAFATALPGIPSSDWSHVLGVSVALSSKSETGTITLGVPVPSQP